MLIINEIRIVFAAFEVELLEISWCTIPRKSGQVPAPKYLLFVLYHYFLANIFGIFYRQCRPCNHSISPLLLCVASSPLQTKSQIGIDWISFTQPYS